MTKAELIAEVKEAMGQDLSKEVTKKEATAAVNSVIDSITKCMERGDDILLQPLGRFGVKFRKARKATNMSTGEPIEVPAKFVPSFSPTKSLKTSVGEIEASEEV